MAEAISDNWTRNLFKDLRLRVEITLHDGFNNEHDIEQVFSTKYKNLYNSVPCNSKRINDIKNEINDKMSEHCNISYRISVADVFNSVQRFKTCKSGGVEGLFSDHIIHGPHLCFVLLANIINCMLVFSISHESMIIGTMVHIQKCKRKMMCCSDNYRAITLSNVVGKVLDWVILLKEQTALNSSDLQFGFKPNVSTTQCTFALNETISYYNSRKTNVYVALLDSTKAFDHVNYCKLFSKLIKKNMSPLILRLQLNIYTHEKLQVE